MATASHPHLAAQYSLGLTSTSKVYRGFNHLNRQKHYPYYPHTPNKFCPWRIECKRLNPPFRRSRRMTRGTLSASPDDGITVNGVPQPSSSSADVEQMRIKLDQTLENEDLSSGLVQSIYDAARAIELAFLEHSSAPKNSWFSRTWLGADRYAWIKSLSYQAAVDSLLQATIEISSRGDGRDRDINVSVQRSLGRLRGPLESEIQEQISRKQPNAYEWYWSNQHPLVVTIFVNLFEKDIRFSAATMICSKGGEPTSSPNSSEVSLLMLSLTCLAAITKLGSTKISCQPFLSLIPDVIGRFMDMLTDFVPISEAYQSMKDISLQREFLFHFGTSTSTVKSTEDIQFWIDLVQRKLQRAIAREKIWSRLTTCECIEVLEKDLAIFGFFIALGRSTQSYLSSNGVTITDDPINGIIRYLIGGSVLYYPQLSSISSYQLYVEVVCEELEWLSFYPSNFTKSAPENIKDKEKVPEDEAISRVLDVSSYWMTSFIKHSLWLENPSNVKASKFLLRGQAILSDCMRELGTTKNRKFDSLGSQVQPEPKKRLPFESELDSFDKALESVEEALVRLENLLQEMHICSSNPGNKEQLQAACSELERIRKLKKEAEFLEASFRAKAASLQEMDADEQGLENNAAKASNESAAVESKPHDFWRFLVRSSVGKTDSEEPTDAQNGVTAKDGNQGSEMNDMRRIEQLTNELIELEKRVQRSTEDAQNNYEETDVIDDKENEPSPTLDQTVVPAPKKDNVIAKSVEKLKETTTDVWQGTQLLAIDVGAAVVLLRRSVTGDELTEKEKKALQRTLTDLASVVPIGILMLLPVTAVGHAAILAFIQRYVPALIPSTYAPERLDLLRQLEKVKEMEIHDITSDNKETQPVN